MVFFPRRLNSPDTSNFTPGPDNTLLTAMERVSKSERARSQAHRDLRRANVRWTSFLAVVSSTGKDYGGWQGQGASAIFVGRARAPATPTIDTPSCATVGNKHGGDAHALIRFRRETNSVVIGGGGGQRAFNQYGTRSRSQQCFCVQ